MALQKIVILIIVVSCIFSAISIYPAGKEEILKKYDTNLGVLKRIYVCIKAAQFKEISGFDMINIEKGNFTLISTSKSNAAFFKSKQLMEFYNRTNDKTLFFNFIKTASAYGIKKGKTFYNTKKGISQQVQAYEARVLIMEHGDEPDVITMVFFADR